MPTFSDLNETFYRPFMGLRLVERTWPSKRIIRAPIWCSVDLRDGNQALEIPMNIEEKLEMFQLLCLIGFKQIEIGFPASSQIEFDFCRTLIEGGHIPEDVTVQVLVQAREELIDRTFEALKGVKRAIVHVYNSTNPAQREMVFGMSKRQVKNLAISAVRYIKQRAESAQETEWVLEYSPETFVLTEMRFALDICQAVIAEWQPKGRNLILNLPETVEACMPNQHADQIEWFCRNLPKRKQVIISVHTHNDRGTGIASSELCLLAGADRVEGTLFGNGERTGNLDIVVMALNMLTQGINPQLNLFDVLYIREVYERCTRMTIHPRHPYAGDLAFTAFSGSHQDAIDKGLAAQDPKGFWRVPYFIINPAIIGRIYEKFVRINSQSGKGGIRFVLETDYGLKGMPRKLLVEFSRWVGNTADTQKESDRGEIDATELWKMFQERYVNIDHPMKLCSFSFDSNGESHNRVKIEINGVEKEIVGNGDGPVDAFLNGLRDADLGDYQVDLYESQSIGTGRDASLACYYKLFRSRDSSSQGVFGVGIDTDTNKAHMLALICAINRLNSS